jgi:small subunit ribosomal protein S16
VAVKIKLMRLGKIRAPYYRIVVADSRTKRDGRAIETIGKYHPTQEPSLIEVDSERAQYWLGVGAQPTEPVAAILKVTGDWQKFKGLPGAEGTLRVAEPKVSKKTTFEAAAKDSSGEAKDGATTPKKRAAKKVAAVAAEGTPAADRPTADEAAAEGDVRKAGKGDKASAAPAVEADAATPTAADAATPTAADAATPTAADAATPAAADAATPAAAATSTPAAAVKDEG